MAQDGGSAEYVFAVTVSLAPNAPGVVADPATFETTLYRRCDLPGEDGWLFFRDNLWRGDLNDEAHFRTLAEEALGVPVESASFSELRTDETHLDRLRSAVGEDLSTFNADTVDGALTKYLGSSIHVVPAGEIRTA